MGLEVFGTVGVVVWTVGFALPGLCEIGFGDFVGLGKVGDSVGSDVDGDFDGLVEVGEVDVGKYVGGRVGNCVGTVVGKGVE